MKRFIRYSLLILLLAVGLTACSTPTEEPESAATEEPAAPTDVPPEPTEEEPEEEQEPAEGMEAEEPVTVTGVAEITFPIFESYITEPYVMLEDQAGFVARDFEFEIPEEDQVIGPLLKEDDTWVYTLHLPAQPPGTLVDVDNNGSEDTGVKVFAVAVQANLIDAPFLNEDEFAGWSSEWTSARIDSENQDEISGGVLIVWAPDAEQRFPTGFGDDGLLFTEDDPTEPIAAGYTVVNLDEDPFAFSKETQPSITLLESDVAVKDYSEMSYAEAFDTLWTKASAEYPFTEMKDVDWDALYDAFYSRAQDAENDREWYLTMRDFSWSIPDGHIGVGGSPVASELFQEDVAGGLGMAIMGLDDGRVVAFIVEEGGPADEAGIQLGAEIIEWNGQPVEDVLAEVVPWSAPFSTQHARRLQQYRYLVRSELGETVEITWQNPNGAERSAELTFANDGGQTFNATSFYADYDQNALPVEYEILEESGYGYLRIWTLSDDLNLTIRLFERAVQAFVDNQVPGIIIDLRQNTGGSPLGASFASYFVGERIDLSRNYYYSDKAGEFETYGPPNYTEPDPDINYEGPIAVLVGPACASACENVAWVFSQLPQVRVVGQYPSNGIYGEVGRGQYDLPDGLSFQIPTGMTRDMDGEIIIEGEGVVPDVDVPVTLDSLLAEQDGEDVILDAAIEVLGQPLGAGVEPVGPPEIGSESETQQAVQSGAPLLEQLAQEEYTEDELSQAGRTYLYTVPLGRSREVLWAYGWCTADQDSFEDNWSKIELEMTLNGEAVLLDEFVELEFDNGGQPCRFYVTLLTDWPAGEHVLTQRVTFNGSLNDGISDRIYPAGTHVYEYHVYVTD